MNFEVKTMYKAKISHCLGNQENYVKKAYGSIARNFICIITAIVLSCVIFSGCNNTTPEDNQISQTITDIMVDTTDEITNPLTQAETNEDTIPPEDESSDIQETTLPEDESSDIQETTLPEEESSSIFETTSSEEESSNTEETTVENGDADVPENKDIYKNPIKLFNKSIMFSANEFQGEYTSVVFKNHGLMLTEGAREGSFVSDEINMGGSFKKMLASWNSCATGGTVEISVSVKLDDGSFTDWYSWGEWSAIPGVSKSKSTTDRNGKVDVDILTLTKECQGIIKYKIDIKQTGDHSPIVYNVTFACDKNESALKAPEGTYIKLDVPYRRQQDVPEIGGSICSATSLSMVMLYHGENITDIADIAWGVRDYGEKIFGNWAFNVAYAGELGYNAYIDFFDIDAIKYGVSTGHPIVCSIKVTKGQLANSGYRGYTTNGHLLCVTGYEERDGQKWLLVNDPAHPEVTAILESDFVNIYRGVSYVVQTRPDITVEN